MPVRQTERRASDFQAAAAKQRDRKTADGQLSDVPAVSGAHVSGRVQVRDQAAVLPRLEGVARVAVCPATAVVRNGVLRAYRFPRRVHQLRAGQTADGRPGPDQGQLREKFADVERAHGGRGENRRRPQPEQRVLQEAQVFRRAARSRIPGRLAGVLRPDGHGDAGPDLGRGAQVHTLQRG